MSDLAKSDCQVVTQRSIGMSSICLTGALEQPQADLDGFKTRELRATAPEQRDMYITEWRIVPYMPSDSARPSMLVLGAEPSSLGHIAQTAFISPAIAAAVVTWQRTQDKPGALNALESILTLMQTQTSAHTLPIWLLADMM